MFCVGAFMIHCFSRKWEPPVLGQGLCPVLMSFILALGQLWSFLLIPTRFHIFICGNRVELGI